MIKYSTILNDIAEAANLFDSFGLITLSNDIDKALKFAAQQTISTTAAATILYGMMTAISRLYTEIYTLKSQNQQLLPVATMAKLQSTQLALSNAVARLNKLIQTGTL